MNEIDAIWDSALKAAGRLLIPSTSTGVSTANELQTDISA